MSPAASCRSIPAARLVLSTVPSRAGLNPNPGLRCQPALCYTSTLYQRRPHWPQCPDMSRSARLGRAMDCRSRSSRSRPSDQDGADRQAGGDRDRPASKSPPSCIRRSCRRWPTPSRCSAVSRASRACATPRWCRTPRARSAPSPPVPTICEDRRRRERHVQRPKLRMTADEGARVMDRDRGHRAGGTKSKLAGVVGHRVRVSVRGRGIRRRSEQLFGHMVRARLRRSSISPTPPASAIRAQVSAHGRGRCAKRWPNQRIGLHLHNTRGLGLADALAGLEQPASPISRARSAGSAAAPMRPRAVGNISTEDFVHMVREMDIDTGIDLDATDRASRAMRRTRSIDPCRVW